MIPGGDTAVRGCENLIFLVSVVTRGTITSSIFTITRATYAFVFGHPLACARILWLPLALMFGLVWLVGPHLATLGFALATATSAPSMRRLWAFSAWLLPFMAGFAVLTAMVHAGLWRFILRHVSVTTPFYFKFGNDEVRLLSSWALKLFFLWALFLALILVTGVLALELHRLSGTPILPAVLLGSVVTMLAVGWVGTRLSLAGPASIEAGRISFGASWRSTRRRVGWLRRTDTLLVAPLLILLLILFFLVLATLPELKTGHLSLTLTSHLTAKGCVRLLDEILDRLLYFLPVLYILLLFFWSLAIAGRAIEYQIAKRGTSGA